MGKPLGVCRDGRERRGSTWGLEPPFGFITLGGRGRGRGKLEVKTVQMYFNRRFGGGGVQPFRESSSDKFSTLVTQTNTFQSHTSIIGHYSLKGLVSSPPKNGFLLLATLMFHVRRWQPRVRGEAPQNRCHERFPVKGQEGGEW